MSPTLKTVNSTGLNISSIYFRNRTSYNGRTWTDFIPSVWGCFAGFLFLLLGIATVTTNGVLLWLLYRKKSTKTFNTKMATSQAMSDILYGFLVSPMEIIHHILPFAGINNYVCLTHQILMLFFPLVSILHLTLVATERFLKIVHPIQSSILALKSRVYTVIAISWSVPFVIAVLPFTGWNRIHESSTYNNDITTQTPSGYASEMSCSRLEKLQCSYLGVVIIIIQSLYILMVTMYFQVIMTARKKVREAVETAVCDLRREVKILYTLLWSVSYYFISWCPFSSVIFTECIYARTPDILWGLTLMITYCNSFISPIIYGYGNRTIREFITNKFRFSKNKVTPVPQQLSETPSLPTEKTHVNVTSRFVLQENDSSILILH